MKCYLLGGLVLSRALALVPTSTTSTNNRQRITTTTSTRVAASSFSDPEVLDDPAIQWELFQKHHAQGSWKGVWTTHDYIGDIIDETIASVDLNVKNDEGGTRMIEHTHTIVMGAKKSDCATCFDSMETKVLPVATYSQDNLRNFRFAAISLVNGPTILRSGAMATELALKHGDGRVRVMLQHAPVWEQGIEPGSCPPQGLKLFRCMISREALRASAPTPETEAKNPPSPGNPIFCRSVPPFNWHKKWSGTSWTWGPQTGNRGWEILELDETDAWHGITPVEQWNLRLGPIHVQCPRIITDANVGLCRLAWLPDDDTLLRVEAGVQALQPIVVEGDDMMVGFEPPTLASLRCDMMKKIGELENVPIPSRDWKNVEEDKENVPSDNAANSSDGTNAELKETKVMNQSKSNELNLSTDDYRAALSI